MSQVQVIHPEGFSAERRYAARVLLETFLGLDVQVSEGRVEAWQIRCDERVLEVPDVFFRTRGEHWLTPASLPDDARLFGEDLFGNAFFMLTRYEEVVRTERDEHGRFPAQSAIAVRGGVAERPLVNETAERLWEKLAAVAPRLVRRTRAFRNLPSHDVDYPYATPAQRLSMLRTGKPQALLPHNPFDTFDAMMRVSEERGLRAAFYFLVRDAPYSLDDPRIRCLLRRIHTRGHEIGYHASYAAFGDRQRTAAEFAHLVAVCEAEGIEQEQWGGRAHFLRWDPATWGIWNEAGLSYDASVGFSSMPGFRAGSCYEYPVFDLLAREALTLRERPLVVMDNPALAAVEGGESELIALVRRLREQCRRVGGDFTSLWHNSWVITRPRRRLFETALEGGH